MWVANVRLGVSVRNVLVAVTVPPPGAATVAVTMYLCETSRAHWLCQALAPWLRRPDTGSPAVRTVTFFSVPSAAVTVMPADGSTLAAPFAGVIRIFAAGAAAPVLAWAAGVTRVAVVCPLPVHAAVIRASAAATAAAPTRRLGVMKPFASGPFPGTAGHNRAGTVSCR